MQMAYVEAYPKSVKGMMMFNCTLNLKETFCSSWIPKAAALSGEEYSITADDAPEKILNEMIRIGSALDEKGLRWEMAYASATSDSMMNATYNEFSNWNGDFGDAAFSIDEYWHNYFEITSQVNKPVLFFYDRNDWTIGPKHYTHVKFPNIMLWGSNVGHIPFIENRQDLEKSIVDYIRKYGF